MKLLTGPLTQRITEVLTRHGVVSDWQQGDLPGSNTGPPLFMAQQQLQRGRPNYVFSLYARKAFDTAPHGALHFILRHLSVPPEIIDLLLFLHTCARLRIVTAHGLTQPVHLLRGVRQGNPESPLLDALFLDPLLRAQGHRLRPPGEAERGLIQAYIDDLLVVAHTLQHFVEGMQAVATSLGMIGMELNPFKCAMATTEGVAGLQLRLCPHLENPWHWVPTAHSVPYLGLQLQPDGEFSLQRKHRLRRHFLSVYFFSIDLQKFIDGSTSSPGCLVINYHPGLFKFWADPLKPWITIKSPRAAIWSRGKRNNLAVNFVCLARSRNCERRPLPSFATLFSWQCRKLGSRNVPQRTRPKANS